MGASYYDNIVTIVSLGAVPPLIDLLSADSDEVKAYAADALVMLSDHADHAATIVSSDGIPPLIELLSGSPDDIKVAASLALGNLALNDDNRATIASADRVAWGTLEKELVKFHAEKDKKRKAGEMEK